MKYIGNSFSLQMLGTDKGLLGFKILTKDDFEFQTRNAYSIVGHEDTARVLGVQMNRESISLKKGDILFIAQITGGRLPEGATKLPQSCTFKFMQVEIK